MKARYLTYIGNVDPLKLEDKVKELAKEKGLSNLNNYDYSSVWEDAQGLTVSEHYIEDYKSKKRIVITFKNSWQRDIKMNKNRSLDINND